jgi:hypothetical protein
MAHMAGVRRSETLELSRATRTEKRRLFLQFEAKSEKEGAEPMLTCTEASGGCELKFLTFRLKNKNWLFCCKTQQKYFYSYSISLSRRILDFRKFYLRAVNPVSDLNV